MNDVVIIEGVVNTLPAFVPGAQLPAYMQNAAEVLGSNLPDRVSIPSLSYEGKVWQVVNGKDKRKLQTKNAEGDIVPMAVMRVVVLGVAPRRGRAYYPSSYDPTKAAQPDCWSSDGVEPDENVKAPISKACQTCPMAAKGSKVTDGREGYACAQHRILAVVPNQDITSEPLRLKIAITSDWDKDNTEPGWFAFQQYVDFLKAQGIAHSGMVVTKMKFDNNTAYPKILFGVDRFLVDAEYAQMIEAVNSPKVAEVIADKFTPAGVNGVVADQSDTAPLSVPGKPEDPAHIAHAGTDSELWWNGTEWVKPWLQPIASAPAAEATQAASTAIADIAAAIVNEIDTAAGLTPAAPTTAVAAKPTDPAYIAHAGTADELWWDGAAWVKPWIVAAAEPAPPPAPPAPPPPAPVVVETPSRPAPSDPAHFHAKGTADELWWNGAEWEKPWLGTAIGATAPAATINPAVASADAALPADVAQLMQKWS